MSLRSMHIFGSSKSIESTIAKLERETIKLEAYSGKTTFKVETQVYRELTLSEQIEEQAKIAREAQQCMRVLQLKKSEEALKKLAIVHGENDRREAIYEYANDLEAIILYLLRPALTVCKTQQGEYVLDEDISDLGHADEDGDKKWEDLLKAHLNNDPENKESGIPNGIFWNAFRSGRVETGTSDYPSWLGSTFLFAKGYTMTNRHVLTYKDFCWHNDDNKVVWSGEVPHEVNFGALYMKPNQENNPQKFREVPYMAKPNQYDCAIILLDDRFLEEPLLQPLPIYTGEALSEEELSKRMVYVIGHPGYDYRNPLGEMSYVFRGIYDIKRIMPGKLLEKPLGVHEGLNVMYHDCSTLGGASGSCVIDFTPGDSFGQVIGLHWGGRPSQQNYAVPIWELKSIWEKYL